MKLKKPNSSNGGTIEGAPEPKPSLSYRASRILSDKKDSTRKRISSLRKK